MWYLVCPNKDGRSYHLTKDKDQHRVSRTTGEIILEGDQSVSRKHAVFTFETDSSGNTVIILQDLASKYGTYLNGSIRLEPHKPHKLKDGDKITFGCQWNEWRFHSKPLVITTSTMSVEAKAKLRQIILELGGTVVSDWQESCSHLTMVEIILTAKVVCALASGVPIVTLEYWEKFKEAIDGQQLPPNCDNFIPPLKESILNKNKVSFTVNEKRRLIFSGKKFVFSSEKQLKKYKTIVLAAGGKCQTLQDSGMTVDELCGPDVVVMQYVEIMNSQPPALYSTLFREMRERGLKPIPESEIGLAILMCSLDMYCNMKYNVVGCVLEGGTAMGHVKNSEILADDSQMSANESVVVKTEHLAIKTEEMQVNRVNSSPVLKIMESSSLSSCGSGSTLQNNQETLPCAFGQPSPISGISMDENELHSIDPGPSRKRPATTESEERPAKKRLTEVKAQESKEKNFHPTEDFRVGDDPQNSNKSRNGVTENGGRPPSATSKRKSDSRGNNLEAGGPPSKLSKEGTVSSLFPNFNRGLSTSRSGISSFLEIEEEEEESHWQKEGLKALKAIESSKWGGTVENSQSRRPSGLKDLGFGMVIKMANLIVSDKDKQQKTESHPCSSSVIDYKKFRKVKPVGTQVALPVIIGESDLVPFKGGVKDF